MADTIPPVLDSSTQGSMLPGPGVWRWTFEFSYDNAFWDDARPLEGEKLDDFFQQFVAGITNLPVELVRPRWQREPPALPSWETNWISQAITASDPFPGWSWQGFLPGREPISIAPDGVQYYVQQQETLTLMTTCYGPKADWYDKILWMGLGIQQNLEALTLVSMGLVDQGRGTIVPELIGQQWRRRVDREIRINRVDMRAYPVRTILTSSGQITTDSDQRTVSWPKDLTE